MNVFQTQYFGLKYYSDGYRGWGRGMSQNLIDIDALLKQIMDRINSWTGISEVSHDDYFTGKGTPSDILRLNIDKLGLPRVVTTSSAAWKRLGPATAYLEIPRPDAGVAVLAYCSDIVTTTHHYSRKFVTLFKAVADALPTHTVTCTWLVVPGGYADYQDHPINLALAPVTDIPVLTTMTKRVGVDAAYFFYENLGPDTAWDTGRNIAFNTGGPSHVSGSTQLLFSPDADAGTIIAVGEREAAMRPAYTPLGQHTVQYTTELIRSTSPTPQLIATKVFDAQPIAGYSRSQPYPVPRRGPFHKVPRAGVSVEGSNANLPIDTYAGTTEAQRMSAALGFESARTAQGIPLINLDPKKAPTRALVPATDPAGSGAPAREDTVFVDATVTLGSTLRNVRGTAMVSRNGTKAQPFDFGLCSWFSFAALRMPEGYRRASAKLRVNAPRAATHRRGATMQQPGVASVDIAAFLSSGSEPLMRRATRVPLEPLGAVSVPDKHTVAAASDPKLIKHTIAPADDHWLEFELTGDYLFDRAGNPREFGVELCIDDDYWAVHPELLDAAVLIEDIHLEVTFSA